MIHKAKKSLGQNFLKSVPALNMMCTVSDLNKDDIVLEIGPGKGALTKKLLEKAGKIIAIEKDFELFSYLQEKFSEEIKNKKLILLNEDILAFEISKNPLALRALPLSRGRKINNYKIIANIPYNITGAIFKKFLSEKIQPKLMTLLIQKEVAKRIVAHDKKESILSLSVKAYGVPSYVMKVEKRFFSPVPKVDSAIVTVKNISRKNFKSKEEENLFFEIIKSGFAHKRKVLIKNLEKSKSLKFLEVGLPEIKELFEKLGINPKIRAEDISLEIWLEITKYFSTNL